MKNGFTLVELVATVVILGLIALILVPVVINLMNKAEDSTILISAETYIKGVERMLYQKSMEGDKVPSGTYNIIENGNLCLEYDTDNITCKKVLELGVKGNAPKEGYLIIEGLDVGEVHFVLDDVLVTKNPKGELVLGEINLAPGLYDENNDLLISWEDLTSLEYKSITYTAYNEETGALEQVTTPILTVDENGVLNASNAIINGLSKNLSAEYLKGKLVIPSTVISIGDSAFSGCTELTSLIIEEGVTNIAAGAFESCIGLTTVVIPNSVTTIGIAAFSGCTGLTEITIPNSVTTIGFQAFSGCTSLTDITIPSSVTRIGDSVFSGCTSLISVLIEEGVIIVDGWAFDGCTGLTEITIPKSVTSIEYAAFQGCTSLTTINYTGTLEEWDAITKGTSWDLNTPSNKVINYNYKA